MPTRTEVTLGICIFCLFVIVYCDCVWIWHWSLSTKAQTMLKTSILFVFIFYIVFFIFIFIFSLCTFFSQSRRSDNKLYKAINSKLVQSARNTIFSWSPFMWKNSIFATWYLLGIASKRKLLQLDSNYLKHSKFHGFLYIYNPLSFPISPDSLRKVNISWCKGTHFARNLLWLFS